MSDPFVEDRFGEIWMAFCDGDKHLVPIGFEEDAERLGLIQIRKVKKADLEKSFASEVGLKKGGWLWELTPTGYIRLLKHAATALAAVAGWMNDYNEVHPHSRLAYRSPREYIRASSQPAACPV